MDALVNRAIELQEDILEKTAEKLDGINARDLPNAYKNIAVGSGVLQDKSRILRDQPTEIVETRSYAQAIRRLMASGVLVGGSGRGGPAGAGRMKVAFHDPEAYYEGGGGRSPRIDSFSDEVADLPGGRTSSC